jgi:hypothetical protein
MYVLMSSAPDNSETARLRARVAVLEDAVEAVLRRFGTPEPLLSDWRRNALTGIDWVYIHAAMNEILEQLRPPPRYLLEVEFLVAMLSSREFSQGGWEDLYGLHTAR